MELITKIKQKPPLLWNVWAIFAIVILIGAIIDIDIISSIYLATEENHYRNIKTPSIYYYDFIRCVVFGLALYGLYLTRKTFGSNSTKLALHLGLINNAYLPTWKSMIFSWFSVFFVLAIIFNPVIPLKLGRQVWSIINLLVVALLIMSLILLSTRQKKRICDNCYAVLSKGYYRNKLHYGSMPFKDLCIWCVEELKRSGKIDIDRRESYEKPLYTDDNDLDCIYCENEKCKHEYRCLDISLNESDKKNEKEMICNIVQCESCGQRLRIPLKTEPLRVTCPSCKHFFICGDGRKTPG